MPESTPYCPPEQLERAPTEEEPYTPPRPVIWLINNIFTDLGCGLALGAVPESP